MNEEKRMSPNTSIEDFELKLKECNFEPALSRYLLDLFKNVVGQADLLASFVPFSIDIYVY